MNKILKISFCLLSVCLILVSMIPTAFANPVEIGFYPMTFSKPTVTDYSGYVELLWRDVNSGIKFVTVVSFCFTPAIDESVSSYTPSDRPILRLVQNGSQFRIGVSTEPGISGYFSWNHMYEDQPYLGSLFISDDQAVRYINFNFGDNVDLVGVHYYGSFYGHDYTSALPNEEFYVTYASETVVCYGLTDIISALYALIDATDSSAYASQLETIISNLNSFEGSFEEFEEYYKTQIVELVRMFDSLLDKLDTLIENTDELESGLQALHRTVANLYNMLVSIESWLKSFYFDSAIYVFPYIESIDSKLQRIIEILESKGESDLTQPDTSNLDGYYDVEHSLLDDSNVDPSQVLNIELNQNALSAIWNLVDRVLNVNPKVFGAVIIILALGILALILGR